MPLPTVQGFYSATNQRRGDVPGTNPSYTFTIPAGVANVNTTIKQFGTGSMWGNTGGGYIQTITTPRTATNVGTGDFTVEFWVYIPAARVNNQTADVIVNNAGGGLGIRMGATYNNTSSGLNAISTFARAGTDGPYALYTWPRDQWNHVVAQRSNTAAGAASVLFTYWVNGVKLNNSGGGNLNAQNFSADGTGLTIGNYNSGGLTDENLRGIYLDEVTVCKGFARYDPVGNIVVPTSSFVVDAPTGILMHMDGTSGSTTFTNATS